MRNKFMPPRFHFRFIKVFIAFTFLALTFIYSSTNSMAEIKLGEVQFKKIDGNEGRIFLKYSGVLIENPKHIVKNNTVEITVPQSSFGKNVRLKNQKLNTNFKIDERSNSLINVTSVEDQNQGTILKVKLPFSLGASEQVQLLVKGEVIEIIFPIEKKLIQNQEKSNARTQVDAQPGIESFDEKYLEKIENDIKNTNEQKSTNAMQNDSSNREKLVSNSPTAKQSDSSSLSSEQGKVFTASGDNSVKVGAKTKDVKDTEKDNKSEFSILGYVGKFVAFLSIMLAGFYGVLQLFKKGIIKKSNLGFLNSTKLVEVLSTTHIAPKKSLLMVRAHKQVFLISSSETGVSLVSELKDVAGLMKEGEKKISGSNFDSNLDFASKENKNFNLKKDSFDQFLDTDEILDDDFDFEEKGLSRKENLKAVSQQNSGQKTSLTKKLFKASMYQFKPNQENGADNFSENSQSINLLKEIDAEKDQVKLSENLKRKGKTYNE